MNAIAVRDLGVRYNLNLTRRNTLRETFFKAVQGRWRHSEHFWALKNVSFDVEQGDILGIVGRNGSGKSTLLMVIAGILQPDAGYVRSNGRVSTLLTLGAGVDRELTGRDNIYLQGAFLGLGKKEIDRKIGDIIDFSELDKFVDVPLRQYSAGMIQRLSFSVAVNIEPDILLIDEVLEVGDAAFRQKCRVRMKELIGKARAILLVSHSMETVQQLCNKALWLHQGETLALGTSREVVSSYLAAMKTLGTTNP